MPGAQQKVLFIEESLYDKNLVEDSGWKSKVYIIKKNEIGSECTKINIKELKQPGVRCCLVGDDEFCDSVKKRIKARQQKEKQGSNVNLWNYVKYKSCMDFAEKELCKTRQKKEEKQISEIDKMKDIVGDEFKDYEIAGFLMALSEFKESKIFPTDEKYQLSYFEELLDLYVGDRERGKQIVKKIGNRGIGGEIKLA